MVIPTNSGEIARYYSDLMYAKYKDPYCWLHFTGGDKLMADISATELLKNLPEKPFFMCSRTDIINLCFYGGYDEETATALLEDGTKFSLSVRRKSAFKEKKDGLKRISPLCHSSSGNKNESCPDNGLFCVPTTSADDKDE